MGHRIGIVIVSTDFRAAQPGFDAARDGFHFPDLVDEPSEHDIEARLSWLGAGNDAILALRTTPSYDPADDEGVRSRSAAIERSISTMTSAWTQARTMTRGFASPKPTAR